MKKVVVGIVAIVACLVAVATMSTNAPPDFNNSAVARGAQMSSGVEPTNQKLLPTDKVLLGREILWNWFQGIDTLGDISSSEWSRRSQSPFIFSNATFVDPSLSARLSDRRRWWSSTPSRRSTHVHLVTIGDSLTLGVLRNLLETKTFRATIRYYPYGTEAAKMIRILSENRKTELATARKNISASNDVGGGWGQYDKMGTLDRISHERFAYPSVMASGILDRYEDALASVMTKASVDEDDHHGQEGLPPWTEELVRVGSFAPSKQHVDKSDTIQLYRLRSLAALMAPDVLDHIRSHFYQALDRLSASDAGQSTVTGPIDALENKQLVVQCLVLAGTNDAMNLARRSMAIFAHASRSASRMFRSKTLPPDDFSDERFAESLNRTVQSVAAIHQRCRQVYVEGYAAYLQFLVLNESLTTRDENRHRFLDSFLRRFSGVDDGRAFPSQPKLERVAAALFPLLTVINVPMSLAPIMIDPSSHVMQYILLPRQLRKDSFHLFGNLCILEASERVKVIRMEALLNASIAANGTVQKMLMGTTFTDALESQVIEVMTPNQTVAIDNGEAKAALVAATIRKVLSSASRRIRLGVAPSAVELSVLREEASPATVKRWGGHYCDCLHPSFPGYKMMMKAIVSQLELLLDAVV